MSRLITLLRTEPAMIASVVQTALALAVALGLSLTAGQTGAIEAVAAAAGAVIVAVATRPVAVPVLTGGLTVIITCLAAFGVHGVTPAAVSEVNAVIVAVLAIVLRGHQTPVASAPKPLPVR